MSHFSVAVFHREDQDIETMLNPYSEHLEVETYISYTKEEAIAFAKKYYNTDGMTDKECWALIADGNETDDNGNILSCYNPDAKWDWWEVGGRWSGMLKTAEGNVDEAKVKDIDFSRDEEAYRKALRFWDVIVDKKPADPDEDFSTWYKPEYFKDTYGDRETYAKVISDFSTFAVILPDGSWHEEGTMGWFGCSSATPDDTKSWGKNYKERFLDTADPELILTIVDCHI